MTEQCGSCAASRAEAAMWQARYASLASGVISTAGFGEQQLEKPTMPRRYALFLLVTRLRDVLSG